MAVQQNSTFNFTDAGVTPFVVKPFTANGPRTPATSTLYANPDGVSAVSANTSLVLVGRGTPYYGDVVQANMVYLLEHFSNRSRPMFPTMGQVWYKKQDYTDLSFPSDPVLKGLYLWNGSEWDAIQMKGTASSAELDMGGFRILNVGDPVAPQDVVNLRGGDARYVRTSGSDMDGSFILLTGSFHVDTGARLSCDDLPTDNSHVVNLQYLNLVSNALTADINSVGQRIDNIVSGNGVYAAASGATFTGNVVLSSSATLIAQSGGPDFSMGGRKISNLALVPTDIADAASKKYVDDSGTTINARITQVQADAVTSQQTAANTYAAKTGATFSGTVNVGISADLTLVGSTASVSMGGRRLQLVGDPSAPTDGATKDYVDTTVATRKVRRYVYVQAGGVTSVTLPPTMSYIVGGNKLQVYRAGIKLVANTRGQAVVTFTGVGMTSTTDTGLTASTTYSVTVNVDGAAGTVLTITTPVGQTSYSTLVALLNAAAVTANLGVVFTLEINSSTSIQIIATSKTAGATSDVVLSYAVGGVFKSIAASSAPTHVAGAVYGYDETGLLGATATQIAFTTAPTNGDIIEFILV